MKKTRIQKRKQESDDCLWFAVPFLNSLFHQRDMERREVEDNVMSLGDRMKEYEDQAENRLDRCLPYMIRLDGHCFSQFTRPFDKPYDVRIHNAMALTTADLVSYFSCTSGYTQSDEITLIFPPFVTQEDLEKEKENPNAQPKAMPHNGRIQKIASLTAGYCSVRFNFHLKAQPAKDTDSEQLTQKMNGMTGFFDARVFNVQSVGELLNNVMWRSRHDCERNSASMLAQAHFSQNVLNGMSTTQQIEKLIAEKGIDWNKEPNWFKYGSLIKRQTYEMAAVNLKTNESVTATRSKLVLKAFRFSPFSAELVEVLTSKYWNSVTIPSALGPVEERDL